MDCVNCGAPLPAKSNICKFCQTLNDVDLRGIQRRAGKGPATDRVCPRCGESLLSIELQVEGGFHIERCDKCLGMWFDSGELEKVLDASASPAYNVDFERMVALREREGVRPQFDDVVKYIKCPVCGELMNRRNYGARSGVIVDSCRMHGAWVDGAELGRLLQWATAGGKLYDQQRKERQQQEKQRKQKQLEAELQAGFARGDADYYFSKHDDSGFIVWLAGFMQRLMR